MSGLARMRAAVAVATVWTSPDSPRALDAPALSNPADMRGWLRSMTTDDKLDLCDANRVQTQILLGTEVVVTEEWGDWVKICIPDQPTPKHNLGYPGWVPRCQLAETRETVDAEKWAEVTAASSVLKLAEAQASMAEELELSFLTRLPVLEETDLRVRMLTPSGEGWLERRDVSIRIGITPTAADGGAGKRIVEQAERFIGLPYLWGGMSSFGYDCSGFAYSMHKAQGITIPRDASAQAQGGKPVARERLEPGDLLFFARDEGKGHIHHVGIYEGEGRMIHSPDSKGAVETVQWNGHKLAKEFCLAVRYWS
ncbi:C40 family peptidase [Paenibacillus hamazuiensis]|uniref:C40 family peptidase n=1 Tax=Paenibacillus hamazuiensis TaxID=2936508 RepID=UPI00200BDCC6|nr:C40 family peptidase [Paenibacillus hamazuiensis]